MVFITPKQNIDSAIELSFIKVELIKFILGILKLSLSRKKLSLISNKTSK
ncbi:hypothetical protein GCM10010918_54130 [Paenibacillus radicis (ex Gao et al. 2016)]|uniref:Uncharacterized protein n=1 Tax=Paenibacillus radicis (ex Gao et al. 2016) TaxID=1737354 RepID=A0A917HTJ5_9BACL|nr:hypothetical protein GCM10010918_54130 [Paenibacillus radicis (ex Gao et al. 2016)]